VAARLGPAPAHELVTATGASGPPQLYHSPRLSACTSSDLTVISNDSGKPVQNAHIESFNRRLRDECLNQHHVLALTAAPVGAGRGSDLATLVRPPKANAPLVLSTARRVST